MKTTAAKSAGFPPKATQYGKAYLWPTEKALPDWDKTTFSSIICAGSKHFFAGSLFLIHNSAVAASFHLLRRQHSPYCLDGPGATSCITTIPWLLYLFPHLSINCIQLLFHMWHFLSHKKTTNLGYYILVKYPLKFTIIRYIGFWSNIALNQQLWDIGLIHSVKAQSNQLINPINQPISSITKDYGSDLSIFSLHFNFFCLNAHI